MMVTDFHSHILPGLDDGAADMEEAIKLLSAMQSWGFDRITCTPHINARYPNTPESIIRVFEQFCEELDRRKIPADIRLSAEYRLVPETWPEVLAKNWLMPIEGKYILMELPISDRNEMKGIIPVEEFRKILSLGLTPVLPHPERYAYLSDQELMEFVETGVVIQCNYGSFAGIYGEDVKNKAIKIEKDGMVSLYGTDMHNMHYVETITQWLTEGNSIKQI